MNDELGGGGLAYAADGNMTSDGANSYTYSAESEEKGDSLNCVIFCREPQVRAASALTGSSSHLRDGAATATMPRAT